MHEGIFIAASAGLKQGKKLEVIANNLANVNNTGFKKDSLVFKEFMPPFPPDQGLEAGRNALLPPENSNSNVSYVGISDQYTDYSPGAFKRTDGVLDVALNGPGYISVSTEEGVRYTRNGNLRLNTKSQLVNQKGQQIQNEQGNPIVIDAPGADISIDQEGNISAGTGLNNLVIGKIKVVDFENTKSLEKIGDGLFHQTDPEAKIKPAKGTGVRQGFLENSNVSTVEEMTDMLATLRLFETYQKMIQSIDSMDDQSVNDIGRVG
ncbi:MAG: flagellar hook-basal body protein [Nitrospina sp.]|jgi:flagellar basal-body rod protein FlgG|nr:flagellar hook-basal body protein [Nitrospina sp.]MBT3875614.1 flagellar hook-basal body protein [Nitrospina sp.]MBT4047573.1 flagellar hook-basal body protein [Nitrospina sp.]MBT4556223.1 flagellar hook-basal body protein [Nitrospina sp.]MBT5348600.1 flagellar hook-basal body protein [Nitrospina sp.]